MVIRQILSRVDDSVHICLHQLGNNVDILIIGGSRGLGHIKHLDNILVIEELEQADLTHDSLGIDQILESLRYLLDGNLAVINMIIGAAHDTISTMANLLDVLELLINAERRA